MNYSSRNSHEPDSMASPSSALAKAVQDKNYKKVKKLLNRGVDSNILGKNNQPLIFELVDKPKLFNLFLNQPSKRFNVDAMNMLGMTAFDFLVIKHFCTHLSNDVDVEKTLLMQIEQLIFAGASYSLDMLRERIIGVMRAHQQEIREVKLTAELGPPMFMTKLNTFLKKNESLQTELSIQEQFLKQKPFLENDMVKDVLHESQAQLIDFQTGLAPYIYKKDTETINRWLAMTPEKIDQYLKNVDTAIENYLFKIQSRFLKNYNMEITLSELKNFLKIDNIEAKRKYIILRKNYFIEENTSILAKLPTEIFLSILQTFAALEKDDILIDRVTNIEQEIFKIKQALGMPVMSRLQEAQKQNAQKTPLEHFLSEEETLLGLKN